MPTTKFQPQTSPRSVSNGSVLSNELSDSSMDRKLTINGNGLVVNGEHLSDTCDGSSVINGQDNHSSSGDSAEKHLSNVCGGPSVINGLRHHDSGRTKKFHVGGEYSNGHSPPDDSGLTNYSALLNDSAVVNDSRLATDSRVTQNGGTPHSVLKDSSPSRSKSHSPDLRVRFSDDRIPGYVVPGYRTGATKVGDSVLKNGDSKGTNDVSKLDIADYKTNDKSELNDFKVSDVDSKLINGDAKLLNHDSSSEITEEQGASGVNPTLWLGDDQMVLLPGKGLSEETDSNSRKAKSYEGLISPNGTSILWDEDTDWILLFDNMIRYADRKQQRTTRSCGCRGKMLNIYFTYNYIVRVVMVPISLKNP